MSGEDPLTIDVTLSGSQASQAIAALMARRKLLTAQRRTLIALGDPNSDALQLLDWAIRDTSEGERIIRMVLYGAPEARDGMDSFKAERDRREYDRPPVVVV